MRRAMMFCVLAAACVGAPSALAQLLDFDSACASPPCAAGSAYAASSVGITPGSLQIVAAGTNGLTGPVGGRFLTVPDPPYQLQITLPRRATSASFWLSRDDGANGNVLVAVTALRNGAVVQTRNRLLTVFGQWMISSIADATGFDQIVFTGSGPSVPSFGLDGVHVAGTCFGFVDVQPTDIFCDSAEWLGNRGVTLGCTLGQYCPGANVTRAQMALFMNRLGNALIPVVRPRITQSFITDFTPDDGQRVCESEPYEVTVRQRALLDVAFTFTPVTGPWTASVTPAYRENGSLFNAGTPGETAHTAASGQHGSVYNRMWLELVPGSTYIFAAFASRIAGSGDLTQGRCRLDVTLYPASSSTAPFDAGD
jgi:hypothetical protein